MAEIRKPDELILPDPSSQKELDLYKSLQDYTKSLNVTFTDLEDIEGITAGDGLTDTANTFSVNVDDSTIETSGGDLQVKDDGIGSQHINSTVAGLGLSASSGAIDVNVDDATLEIDTDTLRVKALGIGSTHLDSTSVIAAKIATDAVETAKIKDKNVTTAKLEDDLTFATFPLTPSAAPDADYEVANKKYVDDNSGQAFGSWASATINSNVGPVAGDGFIVAYADTTGTPGTMEYWQIKTDSSSTPSTVRARVSGNGGNKGIVCITCPVKSGDYYKIEDTAGKYEGETAYIILFA